MLITTLNIGDKKTSGWKFSSQEVKGKTQYFLESAADACPFGQRISILNYNESIDTTNIYRTVDPKEVIGTVDDISCEQITLPENFNDLIVNPKNLNPIICHNGDAEGHGMIIISLSPDVKFIRNIVGQDCEIINTFHNSEKAYGCIVRYNLENKENRSLLKIEMENSVEEKFYHMSINIEDGLLTVTKNQIKKSEIIEKLKEISAKRKYNGFKVVTKIMLVSTIICLEEDSEAVNDFLEKIVTDYNIQEFNVYTLKDVSELENTKHTLQENKIRSALVWNVSKFDYDVIKNFKFLYIFTNVKNSSTGIKNIKSN